MPANRLTHKLKGKDPQIQAWVIQQFNARLFLYFRNRIKGESHYEDLVQEVFGAFFNLVQKGKSFADHLIAPVMFGIARRVMYNYFYRQKRSNKIQERASANLQLTVDFAEEERIEREVLRRQLNELLDRLPAVDKEILNDFYLRDRSIGEISATLHKSPHYISVRKERALKKLKSEISRRKNVFR